MATFRETIRIGGRCIGKKSGKGEIMGLGACLQQPSPSRHSVLLVDPHEDTRNLYACYFKLAGCDIEIAEDGREALAKALARPHDAIVTETRVPGIDGYELCRLLRSDPATLRTTIVIVTGDARACGEDARLAGADAVLVKPCLPEAILATLLQIDRRSAPRAEAAVASPGLNSSVDHAASHGPSQRAILSRVHRRGSTTTPPEIPPTLHCPMCDKVLSYERSFLGGVSMRHAEQWDYFACPAECGRFEYRHRTRKVRRVESD